MSKLITDLDTLRSFNPCNPIPDGNKPVDIVKDFLPDHGIKDAIWCLHCFDYKEYCLFLADLAESTLSIYQEKYPNDKRVEDCINAIRSYHAGDVDLDFLKEVRKAAADAAAAAAAAYAAAAATAAAYAYAADAADADAARNKKWNEIEQLFIKHFS